MDEIKQEALRLATAFAHDSSASQVVGVAAQFEAFLTGKKPAPKITKRKSK